MIFAIFAVQLPIHRACPGVLKAACNHSSGEANLTIPRTISGNFQPLSDSALEIRFSGTRQSQTARKPSL